MVIGTHINGTGMINIRVRLKNSVNVVGNGIRILVYYKAAGIYCKHKKP